MDLSWTHCQTVYWHIQKLFGEAFATFHKISSTDMTICGGSVTPEGLALAIQTSWKQAKVNGDIIEDGGNQVFNLMKQTVFFGKGIYCKFFEKNIF